MNMKRKTQKRLVETGLIGSMVGMVATGFLSSKKTHIAVSGAFVAFTLVHFNMYRPLMGKRKKKPSRKMEAGPA